MVLNPSVTDAGIVNRTGIMCHQLEAPELNIDTDTNGQHREKCESTHQVPFGEFSALSELRSGNLRAVETLILSVLNYRSNWQSGKTWRSSLRELSKLTGISIRYLRDNLSNLMDSGWLSYISKGVNFGSRYQVTHHLCDRGEVPTDKDGRPLKFAVPRGKGGILERLFTGDISWKSALIWFMLKLHSDWKTGVTYPISIETLRKYVSMSPQTVCDCLGELEQAGLLKRTNPKHEAGIYQLYPKPNGKPKPVYRPKREKSTDTRDRAMRADGDWRFSFNELWRVNVETYEVQTRPSRRKGVWRKASDYERYHEMPKAILEAFDECLKFHHLVKASWKSARSAESGESCVTDSDQPVTDTAQGLIDTAQLDLFDSDGVNGSKGSSST